MIWVSQYHQIWSLVPTLKPFSGVSTSNTSMVILSSEWLGPWSNLGHNQLNFGTLESNLVFPFLVLRLKGLYLFACLICYPNLHAFERCTWSYMCCASKAFCIWVARVISSSSFNSSITRLKFIEKYFRSKMLTTWVGLNLNSFMVILSFSWCQKVL